MYTVNDVARICRVHRVTVHRWIRAGIIVAPDFRTGDRVIRWNEKTIDAWIKKKKPGR